VLRGGRIKSEFQQLSILGICCLPTPTKIQPDWLNDVNINHNKIVTTARKREGALLAPTMAKLDSKTERLQRCFLQECAIPKLVILEVSPMILERFNNLPLSDETGFLDGG
jgi:hypothetical protein